jgi:ParB family chromosome partitioning protein
LAPTTAYEVSKLDDPDEQRKLADRVVAEGLKCADVTRVVRKGKPKGRGGKPSKVTSRTFRTPAGPRVVVEFKRGLEPSMIVAAMQAVIDQVRGEESEAAA